MSYWWCVNKHLVSVSDWLAGEKLLLVELSKGVVLCICRAVKEYNNKTTYLGEVKVSNRPVLTRRYLTNGCEPLACL